MFGSKKKKSLTENRSIYWVVSITTRMMESWAEARDLANEAKKRGLSDPRILATIVHPNDVAGELTWKTPRELEIAIHAEWLKLSDAIAIQKSKYVQSGHMVPTVDHADYETQAAQWGEIVCVGSVEPTWADEWSGPPKLCSCHGVREYF